MVSIRRRRLPLAADKGRTKPAHKMVDHGNFNKWHLVPIVFKNVDRGESANAKAQASV